MNTVQEQWERLRREVIAPDAPDAQVREMRRAFYAGAYSMLHMMDRISSYSENVAIPIIQGIEEECEDFKRRIGTDY